MKKIFILAFMLLALFSCKEINSKINNNSWVLINNSSVLINEPSEKIENIHTQEELGNIEEILNIK